MLWGLLSFKQHLLFGRSKSKPPRSRSQAESASVGFGGGHARANPAEALSAWFLLPGGLLWHVHRQTPPKHFRPDFCFPGVCSGMSTAKPRRSTFGLISASRGFALACPPPNPAEALSAWFLLPGGLLWHVHRQTPPKHFRPHFCFPGLLWHVHRQTPPKHFRPHFCFPGVCCGIFIRAARRCGRWFPERDCILEH